MANMDRSNDPKSIENQPQRQWQPNWWKDETQGSSWERVKAAVVRDWEQTKKDLHMGGKHLHQDITDTVKQAAGKERIPPPNESNPAKVVGTLRSDELPIGYGYGARMHYGDSYRDWNQDLEGKLRMEWEGSGQEQAKWDEVRDQVKYGYEYKH